MKAGDIIEGPNGEPLEAVLSSNAESCAGCVFALDNDSPGCDQGTGEWNDDANQCTVNNQYFVFRVVSVSKPCKRRRVFK